MMNRRNLLSIGAASTILGAANSNLLAAANGASSEAAPTTCGQDEDVEITVPDGLNPPNIRTAGIRMVPVVGGKYKVWTKRIGHGPIKVLLLHGGSGFGHQYLEAMESFLPQAGIEMHYYDQLGCNNSDQPDDTTLWTLPRYVEEVEEVRRGLGLENFVLYGHSWGGMMAIDYALKYQQHLRGLVISNMSASMRAFEMRTAALRRELLTPADLSKMLSLEAAGNYNDPEYQRILNLLYTKMLCRTNPWPEPFTRTLKRANFAIYTQMFGPNEFVITGNQQGWDRWGVLNQIRTKALTIGAKWDEMDPEDMKKMAKLMPNARSVICPTGSHLCMWDDQAFYFQHLLEFLNSL
jgi:proline iminopeptidase